MSRPQGNKMDALSALNKANAMSTVRNVDALSTANTYHYQVLRKPVFIDLFHAYGLTSREM